MSRQQSGGQEHERYIKRLSKLERPTQDEDVSERQKTLTQSLPEVTQQQKSGNRRRFFSVVVPFGLILLVCLYIISPLSKVNQVVVRGNDELTAEQVERASRLTPGRYIWNTTRNQEQTLKLAQKNNKQIKSLAFKRTGWRSIQITVAEYPTIGLVSKDGRLQQLLANGQSIPAQKHIKNFINYSGFSKSPVHLKNAAREIGKLPRSVRSAISDVTYSPTTINPDRLILLMNDGNTVYVTADELSSKMKYYPAIVSQMNGRGVINLQYGAYSHGYKQTVQ